MAAGGAEQSEGWGVMVSVRPPLGNRAEPRTRELIDKGELRRLWIFAAALVWVLGFVQRRAMREAYLSLLVSVSFPHSSAGRGLALASAVQQPHVSCLHSLQ